MTKYYTNTFSVVNLYKKPSVRSEIVTEMIYGESFSIILKTKKWIKIKIKEDNYKGYIQNNNFKNYFKSSHKICKLKAIVYKSPNNLKKKKMLTFGSKIKVIDNKFTFYKFEEGWVKKKDVKQIKYKEKNVFKRIKLFNNVKYKWGGKSFKGIDCSGLIQVCLNFNNIFCPRDAKDQAKFFKNNINIKNIKKNDIFYWKGHVAVALSKNLLIHAYGPFKKTIIMNTTKTLKLIKKTAKLKLKYIKRIK
jgi:cell wall-associated NlpC family hydrolase